MKPSIFLAVVKLGLHPLTHDETILIIYRYITNVEQAVNVSS